MESLSKPHNEGMFFDFISRAPKEGIIVFEHVSVDPLHVMHGASAHSFVIMHKEQWDWLVKKYTIDLENIWSARD